MHKAVFMDRDGTVSEEVGYMYHAGLYRPYAWTGPAIRKINHSGMKAILVTNQSGVERGYFAESTVHEVHEVLRRELERNHAHLDAVYYCPHLPETGCSCRKPNPGMLLQAQQAFDLDLARSFVIGDRRIDLELAHAVGATGVLVMTGDGRNELALCKNGGVQPDMVADNLMAAVEAILETEHA